MIRKLYFAINQTGIPGYEHLIKATVLSARQNSELLLNCLYHGEDHPFLGWMHDHGVNIIRHTSSFIKYINAHPSGANWHAATATGAYLRLDIPIIETEDDYVLYTDCDVLFANGFKYDGPFPKYIACAPEHDSKDWRHFNSGVMVMNIATLRSLHDEIGHFIKRGIADFWKAGRGTYDQGVLNAFFAGQWDRLPLECNWKPYWGRNDSAQIIHFHGPKPEYIRRIVQNEPNVPAVYKTLYNLNPQGCKYYLEIYKEQVKDEA